jgi:hypothetical protein
MEEKNKHGRGSFVAANEDEDLESDNSQSVVGKRQSADHLNVVFSSKYVGF